MGNVNGTIERLQSGAVVQVQILNIMDFSEIIAFDLEDNFAVGSLPIRLVIGAVKPCTGISVSYHCISMAWYKY